MSQRQQMVPEQDTKQSTDKIGITRGMGVFLIGWILSSGVVALVAYETFYMAASMELVRFVVAYRHAAQIGGVATLLLFVVWALIGWLIDEKSRILPSKVTEHEVPEASTEQYHDRYEKVYPYRHQEQSGESHTSITIEGDAQEIFAQLRKLLFTQQSTENVLCNICGRQNKVDALYCDICTASLER